MSRNSDQEQEAGPEGEGIRLQVYLARCGLGSRRGCEELILKGRVSVNGQPVTRLGARVLAKDAVTVNGRAVRPSAGGVYVALHKPRGFLCSNQDPAGRPMASSLFSSVIHERLHHVGRLDFLSSGLIFYTNDGEFTRLVSHPSSQIEKEYLVETGRPVEEPFLRQYLKGIRVEDTVYRCKSYVLRGPRSVLITLTEGKNRELRKVFASRNIRVKRIHRLRIGPVTLAGLQPGHFRMLNQRELRWFQSHGADRPGEPAPGARPPKRRTGGAPRGRKG
ncbi:MAG TPA: pseudouridine synthase [Spirochaetia bacterium]|nr:pseudouridine synthase [Spirochaetia bacterium]